MSNKIQKLGNVLNDRMQKAITGRATVTVELGVINSNASLTTDGIPAEIPKGDYFMPQGTELQPGDRVLVAWCGMTPVITAVVVQS